MVLEKLKELLVEKGIDGIHAKHLGLIEGEDHYRLYSEEPDGVITPLKAETAHELLGMMEETVEGTEEQLIEIIKNNRIEDERDKQ